MNNRIEPPGTDILLSCIGFLPRLRGRIKEGVRITLPISSRIFISEGCQQITFILGKVGLHQ
jgi:hypothetical protein